MGCGQDFFSREILWARGRFFRRLVGRGLGDGVGTMLRVDGSYVCEGFVVMVDS